MTKITNSDNLEGTQDLKIPIETPRRIHTFPDFYTLHYKQRGIRKRFRPCARGSATVTQLFDTEFSILTLALCEQGDYSSQYIEH
jgi:hypothetical protein